MTDKDPNAPIVLIVDDDPATLHELGAALTPFARVRVALGGQEALELVSAGRELPDLILLDILMPGMDGYETCRLIRNLEFAREIPIIFITSLTSSESMIKALEGGALDFITKPFELKHLRRKVCNHLELLRLRGQALVQARRELRETAETKRAILDALPDVIMRLDPQGNYLFVSENVDRVCGIAAREFMGKNLEEFGYPDRSIDLWTGALRRVVATREPSRTEISFTGHNGPAVHELRLAPEFDENGEVVSVLTISRDITEQRRAEARLNKGETIIEAQAGLVSVLAAGDSDFTDLSRAIHQWSMRITGSSMGFALAMDPDSGRLTHHALAAIITPDECGTAPVVQKLLKHPGLLGVSVSSGKGFLTNAPQGHPAFRGLPDGHPPLGQFLAVPAMHKGQVLGQIALANPGRDYTQEDLDAVTVLADLFALAIDRLISTRDLQRAKNQAETASLSKTEFLTNMSHEIRTPLNGILGMLQLMQDTTLSAEQQDYTTFAMRSCRRLTSLLTDILNLARLEAGIPKAACEPLDLSDTLDAVHQIFLPAAQEKGLTLELRLDPALPRKVAGDGPRLMQILNNLVGNAVKFTESGVVTLEASPLRTGADGCCRVLFTVTDAGIGIPDDRFRELFEPFAQIARGFTRSHQGAGLGLAITRKLVRLLGGVMCASSEDGLGTEMAVVLPLACATYLEDRTERIKSLAARNDLGLRVLLAEDDAVSRFAATRMLQRLGCVVTEADNGQAALEALIGQEFDLVLMDVQMPFMDGVQATRILRTAAEFRHVADIPVVALTAYAAAHDTENFVEAGMNMHLSKPVRMENLLEAIVSCVIEDTPGRSCSGCGLPRKKA